MVATNAVGPDAGGSYYFGHSMIVNPIAWRLAQARGGEEISPPGSTLTRCAT